MVLRLNGTQLVSTIQPTNRALTKIAQARIDNTVSRAVARHAAAIAADGSDIYMWLRSNTGLICTCRQPPARLQAVSIDTSPEGLRTPNPGSAGLPTSSSRNADFKLLTQRGVNGLDFGGPSQIPLEFAGINQTLAAGEQLAGDDDLPQDLKALTTLNHQINDQQLATMLSEGAAINGGDKTACGICFGTGRTHGYDLATGKRLVLDASNEFVYSLNEGAYIKPHTFPAQFNLNCNGVVSWLVDLPSYTNGWLNFTIRDNLQPAGNLILEWFYRHHWQPLTVTNLAQSEGTDRTQTPIRVRMPDNAGFDQASFTHVELIYSTTKPLLGQSPPLNYATNYEISEPLITTEFEILANVTDIPRESVFQDAKFKYLWKVQDVTPKMTARGQVFSLVLNARMVHRSEALYALKVIFDPMVSVHYRGLEIEEGGLEVENIIGAEKDNLRWTLDTQR